MIPDRLSVRGIARALALASGVSLLPLGAASAATYDFGTLFVSTSSYAGSASTLAVGQALPNTNGARAIADGSYPGVFANDTIDPNFGITAPIQLIGAVTLSSPDRGVLLALPVGFADITARTGITTSFPSKSELALNFSTDGGTLSFVGYRAASNSIDVSNSNTPNHVDPTNTDTAPATPRSVVSVALGSSVSVTDTNAYSGNNGRAAVLVRGSGQGQGQGRYADALFLVGNAGNGSGTEPLPVIADTGVQTIAPTATDGASLPVGAVQGTYGKNGFQYGFSVASLGYPADKSGKDDNFRGLTVFGNHVYVSKGSGGNGVNTVYQVSAPGGLSALASNAAGASITILPGFPTGLAASISATDTSTQFYPFGIWFANATTLYVADEGVQALTADPNAGLQKWIFDGSRWNLAYTLQAGLQLDQPYQVVNYSGPQPSTTGLRNLTGHVDGNTVTLFAATATYSAAADPGADPNKVVQIVDRLDATTPPAGETFRTLLPAISARIYRGVAYGACGDLAQCFARAGILPSR